MTDIDNNQDMLDVRDIIARFEELETEVNSLVMGHHNLSDEQWDALEESEQSSKRAEYTESVQSDEVEEYETLKKLLEELKGNGGDEQWRGDWYPVTMIRDSYFEDAMDELIEDCYNIDQYKLPSFMSVRIDYDALQMDYSSVDYDGVDYWYR